MDVSFLAKDPAEYQSPRRMLGIWDDGISEMPGIPDAFDLASRA